MNVEKLTKMASVVRIGGKGSVRRKKKLHHKTIATIDIDKRLQNTLKRIGVNEIPVIEEVNIFRDDIVIQFLNPKVQGSIYANTWVVSGYPKTKTTNSEEDILSSVLNELGPDYLRKILEELETSSDLTTIEKEL